MTSGAGPAEQRFGKPSFWRPGSGEQRFPRTRGLHPVQLAMTIILDYLAYSGQVVLEALGHRTITTTHMRLARLRHPGLNRCGAHL